MRIAERGTPPALLVYLFADRTLPRARIFTGPRVSVPCSGGKVHRTGLARLVFAVTFWNLWQQGRIDLQLSQRERLGGLFPQMTSTAVWISIHREVDYLEGLGRFERSVMLAAETANDVYGIVRAWLGGQVENPWSRVVDGVRAEAIERGFLTPQKPTDREMLRTFSAHPTASPGQQDADPERLLKRLLRSGATEPDCVQIGWLQGQHQDFMSRWSRFRHESEELYRLLLSECGDGLRRCKETED